MSTAINLDNLKNQDISDQKPTLGPIDITKVCPEANFCSKGVQKLINLSHSDYSENSINQCDVYYAAEKIARKGNIKHIIDFGCGNGEKLAYYFPNSKYKTFGLDTQVKISVCKNLFPSLQWHSVFLNSYISLEQIYRIIDIQAQPLVIILSDILENLYDIRPLLAVVRSLLLSNPQNRLVVSSVERERISLKSKKISSLNPDTTGQFHIRQWSFNELCQLFVNSGFQIESAGFTRNNQYDSEQSACFLSLYSSPKYYSDFLNKAGLTYGDAQLLSRLLVTNEHAAIPGYGGIGSYCADIEKLSGSESLRTLYVCKTEANFKAVINASLLSPNILLPKNSFQHLENDDIAWKTVEAFLFFIPWLKTIECIDYIGIGARIAQARCAGLIPSVTEVKTKIHGPAIYVENASEDWLPSQNLENCLREKVALELSDSVEFCSTFLDELCKEQGINIPDNRKKFLRYPFFYTDTEFMRSGVIDEIIFIGKQSRMKGFPEFTEAVHSLLNQKHSLCTAIKKITIFGAKPENLAETKFLLEQLKNKIEIEELSLPRIDLLNYIRRNAHRCLVVLPYKGDNHPFVVLETIDCTAPMVAFRAGGIPALIPESYHELTLSNPNANSLTEKILQVLSLSEEQRDELRCGLKQKSVAEQDVINKSVIVDINTGGRKDTVHREVNGEEITVIVPVYNTGLNYVTELCEALNSQIIAPKEVIFTNDASEPVYSEQFNKILENKLKIPYRILVHTENKGLAAARCSALLETQTKYVVNVDSDDIPLPDFLYAILQSFSLNPQISAIVPYLEAFNDGDDWNKVDTERYVYRPLGEGVIAAQTSNTLGHANSAFRTDILKKYGAWDGKYKDMWEDWELFLSLKSQGENILVIPKELILYRVRKTSMARTYSKFHAMTRLARGTKGLSRFEAYRLQGMARKYSELEKESAELHKKLGLAQEEAKNVHARLFESFKEYEKLLKQYNWLQNQYERFGVKVARKLIEKLERTKIIYKPLKFFIPKKK